MKIKSLSRQSDLIFARFNGSVTDRGNYTVVRTPSNPGFHWGNFIIFNKPPQPGDFKKWSAIFKDEFSNYETISHMTFTWDSDPLVPGEYKEFELDGFEFEEAISLATDKVVVPPKINESIVVKKLSTENEWENAIQLQILTADPKYQNSNYEAFKRDQFKNYRKMNQANMGSWFGAYLEEKLVCDLGIFYEGPIARYQNVGTHPDFRRQGICQTLVYKTAQIALKEFNVKTLVMEADADYHAAKIYESVGFKPIERNYSLSWWQNTAG